MYVNAQIYIYVCIYVCKCADSVGQFQWTSLLDATIKYNFKREPRNIQVSPKQKCQVSFPYLPRGILPTNIYRVPTMCQAFCSKRIRNEAFRDNAQENSQMRQI